MTTQGPLIGLGFKGKWEEIRKSQVYFHLGGEGMSHITLIVT